MKCLCAILLVTLFGCTSTARPAVASETPCKTDAALAAEAEATAMAVERAVATGQSPPATEDASKTPAQLAQEAAMEAAPCGAVPMTDSQSEIPQIDRVPQPEPKR